MKSKTKNLTKELASDRADQIRRLRDLADCPELAEFFTRLKPKGRDMRQSSAIGPGRKVL